MICNQIWNKSDGIMKYEVTFEIYQPVKIIVDDWIPADLYKKRTVIG